jgi:NAD(P)-dependent dehydrogenase (short-subunit alcohol dehydrogenase family)
MGTFTDTVVVVTGASSGIGRATALRFAGQGAAVVLAARRADVLEQLAGECDAAGGRGLAVPTDVTDGKAVDELARRAVAAFGRIDVWVNNAAVTLFANFGEAPPELDDRVIDTNLLGYVRGARAALPHFREQGQGVLINVASVFGKAGAPYISAYVASKFGIVGFSESLRMELLDEPDIHVCTVLPASIDTPIFRHAANFTGRAVKPMDPVYDADVVAKAIVRLAERPQRERIVGGAGRLLRKQRLTSPGAYEHATGRMVHREHFFDQPAGPTAGNVEHPLDGWNDVSGGWTSSPAPLRRGVLSAAGLAVGGALAWRAWRRR